MFYAPFKLRESNRLKTPKGPKLGWWVSSTRIDIAGTELSFRVPSHRPEYRGYEPVYPERRYTKESLPLRSYYNEEDAAKGRKDNWRSGTLLYHTWAFYGPWFTGVLSELRLWITLIRPVNYPQNFSLFHPRALEKIIGDYLDSLYSHQIGLDGRQVFIGPMNWQPLSHLPVNTVRLEVAPHTPYAPTGSTDNFVFFPLADDLMVRFRFDPSRFLNLPQEEVDKLVDIQPMHDLMNDIINSIQVKLSPEAQARQAKALEGLADTSLAKEFPPLKWDKLSEEETETILMEAQNPNVRAR